MGVTYETWKLFDDIIISKNIRSICELGDQQFFHCPPFQEESWVGDYLKPLGYHYVSIDINGKGGSVIFDLNFPVTYPEQFDIVTNFGTAEHTRNLYSCLHNMHKLCKLDGYMLHVAPAPGNWKNHGNFYLDIDFFEGLADICDYTILELFKRKVSFGGEDSKQTHCLLQKNREKFCAEDAFNKLPIRGE